MAELDPATNLPEKESTQDSTPLRDTKKPSAKERLQSAKRNTPLRGSQPTIVKGTFGDYGGALVTPEKNFNEIRAQDQSGFKLLGNSLAQTAGTAVGMGIESVGFLGDIPQAVDNMVTGSQMDWERNGVADFGSWIQEKTQETFPIYLTEQAKSGELSRFVDPTYWAKHAPSIVASSAAFYLPGAGIAKGASLLSRALGAGRAGQQIAATLSATFGTRHMENMLEGSESYEQIRQSAIQNGVPESEADRIASEQAAQTYRLGYSNVWTDALQWGALLRGVNFPNRAIKGSLAELGEQSGDDLMRQISRTLKRNPDLTVKQAAKKTGVTWKDFLAQSGLEGFEEFNQSFIKRLSQHNADVSMGLTDGSQQSFAEAYIGGMLGEHLQDPEAWDSAIMGFLGGALFQGVGMVGNKQWNKDLEADNARRLKAEQERAQYIQDTLRNINIALTKGNETNAQKERENLIFNMAINGAKGAKGDFSGAAVEGTLGTTIEMFDAINTMSDQELEALGLDPETARQEAEWASGELQQIGDSINNYYSSVTGTGRDEEISIMLASQDYRNKKNRDHLADVETRISQMYDQDEAISGAMSGLSPEQKELIRTKNELEAKKKILKDLKNEQASDVFGLAPFRGKIIQEARKNSISNLEQGIQELSQQLSHLAPKSKRKSLIGDTEVEDIASEADIPLNASQVNEALSIAENIAGESSKLQELHNTKEETEIELMEGEKELSIISRPDKQKEMVEYLSTAGEKLRQGAYRTLFKRRYDSGSYINKDGDIFKISHEPDSNDIRLTPVGKDLMPTGEDQIFNPEDIEDYLNVTEVDPERALGVEEVDYLRKEFSKALKEGRFEDAFSIINDELYRSNFTEAASRAMDTFQENLNEKIDNMESYQELLDLHNRMQEVLHPGYAVRVTRKVQSRISELQEQRESELIALEKAISKKEDQFNDTLEELQKKEDEIESIKNDLENFTQDVLTELQEQGIQKLDRRTKPAKKIEAMEKSVEQQIKDLKQEQRTIVNQASELEKDIGKLKKIKETLDQAEMPSVILNKDLKETFDVIEGLRAKLMLRADITEEQAETLKERYFEAEQDIEKAIHAIENFRDYIHDITVAGSVLREAADSAYNTLLDQGVLSGTESLFDGVDKQIFQSYRIEFNKQLTSIMREDMKEEDITPRMRRFVNENRLVAEDYQLANTDFWVRLNTDFPVKSDLFQADDVKAIQEATDNINDLIEFQREARIYQGVLQLMSKEINRRKASIEPEGTKKTKEEEYDVKQYDAPQKTIFTAFTRPTGNSGTNDDPSPEASQRRYFRFVNKTNFSTDQYNLKIIRPEEGFVDKERLAKFGYDPEEVLIGVVTNEEGEYLNENGEVVSELNPDEVVYTTMALPTYETISSGEGRTFTPDSYYLAKTYPELKNEKERLEAYEADKERELEKYKALRESWKNEIEENGFAEIGIVGKSLGVADKKPNHGRYDQGVEPNKLGDVFEDPYSLEFEVNTSDFKDHHGEIVSLRKGFTTLKNPETGNEFEGAVRQLREDEVRTLIELLRLHVRQSEIKSTDYIDISKATSVPNTDKTIFEIFKDYTFSFDQKKKSPIDIERVNRDKYPGGRILIEGQAYEIFADNPEGEGKINQVNPKLVEALKGYLSDKFIQVSSSKIKNNESFERVIFKDGEFKTESYDSYKEYLIENDVVGTWRKPKRNMTVESEGVLEEEEGYILYNQNVIYDVPEIATESRTDSLQSLEDLPEGESYITPVKEGAPGVWKVTRRTKKIGAISAEFELVNKSDLSKKAQGQAEKVSNKQLIKGISDGKFKFTEYSEQAEETETSEEPPLAQIQQQMSGNRKKASETRRSNLKKKLDNLKGEGKKKKKSTKMVDKLKGGPQEQRVSDGRSVTEKELTTVANKLEQATGIPVKILTTGQAIDLMEQLRFQGYHQNDYAKSPESLPYGMYHNGTAYIFGKENMNLQTLFHEIAHPVIDQIIDTNPYLFEQLKKDLAATEEGQKIIGHVLRNYPEIFEDGDLTTRGWAEVIVTAIGRAAESKQLQKNKNIDSFLTKIFKAIKDFFNSLFSNPVNTRDLGLDTTVEDIASMLVEGTSIDIDARQATEYSKRAKPPTINEESRMIIPGESLKFTQDTLNMVNYWFFQYLFDDYSDQLNTLFTEKGNKGLHDKILSDVRDELIDSAEAFLDPSLAESLEGYTAEDLNEEADKLIRVVEKFDDVRRLYMQHLQKYNVEAVTEESLETELDQDTNKLWQDDHLIFSAKQNATSAVRFLIGSLTSSKTNDTFKASAQTVDFGETFNILANKMSGTTTLEEKKSIIKRLKDQDGFGDLYQRLFRKDIEQLTEEDIGTAMYLLQFNEVFSKHFNDYTLIIKDAVNVFKAIDATINSGKSVLLHEWQSNTYDKKETFKIENGRLVYDQSYFKEKFPDKVIETENGKKTIPYRIIQDMNLTPQQEEWANAQNANERNDYRNHYKVLNFLEEIGIEFSSEAYHTPAGEEFNKRAQFILDAIKKGESPDIYAEDSDSYQDLQVIAEHEIDNSVDRVENQHLNIEGETVYNVVLNHYVSMVEDKINNLDSLADIQKDLPHLFNTAYTENSLLLNRRGKNGRIYNNLFDQDGNKATYKAKGTDRKKKLTIDITEGMRNNTDAKSFNDLTYTDKIHMAINSLVEDRFSLFRAGDKKLERYIPLEFFTASEIIENNNHIKVFTDYLVDEIKFISEIAENPDQYSGVNNLVSRNEDGDIQVNYEFSILPNLFSQNKQLKSLIDKAIKNGDINEIYQPENRQRIQDVVNSYFQEKVEETKDLLQEHMVLQKEGDMYKNNGLIGLTDNKGEGYNDAQLNRILWKVLVNRSIANIEQTKLFTAHPAFYSKSDIGSSLDNFFHRMSGAVGTKKISSTGDLSNKLINKFFPSDHRLYKYVDENGELQTTKEYSEGVKPIIRSAVFKDPVVTSRYTNTIGKHLKDTSMYEDMEESDAMGLVHLDTYRDMKIRSGEWGEPLERLYQWVNRPEGAKSIEVRNWTTGEMEEVTVNDLKNNDGSRTVFTMLKPQYFGPLAEEGFIPGMYKLAVLPVLPSYENEAMSNVRDYMNNNDVGLVTFESANKVGTKNPGEEVYNDSGVPELTNGSIQDSWYDYWGLQLQTGNKIKDKVILGSQFMKQIISGIYDQGNPVSDKLDALANEMGDVHNALIETGKEELREELELTRSDNGEYTTDSVQKLVDFLRREAIERDANHNVIDSLEYLENYIDGNMGLDVMSNKDKIENILASIADKRVISQDVHGGAKVQAASTFFENQSRVKAGSKWLSQEDLNFYEDGTMEVYMPHYFKEFFDDRDASNIESELLRAIGFRIPTSGMNVIENIKIKGFLPQDAGEVIVLPTEIVAKAGSDFDVDKLNVLLPNYKIVDGEPKYIRYLSSREEANQLIQDISKDLSEKTGRKPKKERVKEELRNRGYTRLAENINKAKLSILEMNTREGLQNGLYSISSEIMMQEEMQKAKFTPIDIDILKDQKERIDDLRGVKEKDPSFHKMLFDFNYYQRLTQRNIESLSGTGMAALHTSDHVHSTRYNYLMTNDHQIALPHNQNENGLVSLGGKYTADGKNEIGNLLNQITNMFIDGVKNPLSFGLNLNLETGGTALYLTRAGVPPKVLFSFINQPAVRDYIHLKGINESLPNQNGDIIEGDQGISTKLSAKYGQTETDSKISYTELNRYLKPENQKGKAYKKFQRKVLNEYKKYEKSAQRLSDYVNSTRVDTVAMGKNTAQLDLMLRSLDKIADGGIDVLNTDKLLKREENGFLAPHYKALQDFRSMFEPFFIHLKDSNAFEMYNDLLEFVDEKPISMEEKTNILDKFKNDYITYRVLNSQTTINGMQVNYMGGNMDLFTGDNSLPKRIMKIKKNGTDNILLNKLLPIIGKQEVNGRRIDNLKLMDQRLDTLEQNQLIEAWRDLFFQNEPLARDLVQFTFIQNGLQLSPMTFTKYIPAEIYMEVLDGAFSTNENVESVHFLEKFVENNYNDENIVPTKWGQKTPSGDIYKVYKFKKGYNLDNAAEARSKGINPYKPTPIVVVKKGGMKIGGTTIFEGDRRVNVQAVKDFRNNRALLSYGLKSDKSRQSEDPEPSLTEEQIRAMTQEINMNPKDRINDQKRCE